MRENAEVHESQLFFLIFILSCSCYCLLLVILLTNKITLTWLNFIVDFFLFVVSSVCVYFCMTSKTKLTTLKEPTNQQVFCVSTSLGISNIHCVCFIDFEIIQSVHCNCCLHLIFKLYEGETLFGWYKTHFFETWESTRKSMRSCTVLTVQNPHKTIEKLQTISKLKWKSRLKWTVTLTEQNIGTHSQ